MIKNTARKKHIDDFCVIVGEGTINGWGRQNHFRQCGVPIYLFNLFTFPRFMPVSLLYHILRFCKEKQNGVNAHMLFHYQALGTSCLPVVTIKPRKSWQISAWIKVWIDFYVLEKKSLSHPSKYLVTNFHCFIPLWVKDISGRLWVPALYYFPLKLFLTTSYAFMVVV